MIKERYTVHGVRYKDRVGKRKTQIGVRPIPYTEGSHFIFHGIFSGCARMADGSL